MRKVAVQFGVATGTVQRIARSTAAQAQPVMNPLNFMIRSLRNAAGRIAIDDTQFRKQFPVY